MTKEQFFTFKSDMKKGMRIQKLFNSHRKAYWNEGFATEEDQKKAINKDMDEIISIKETIGLRKHKQKWVTENNGWKGHYEDSDETYPIVLGAHPKDHWAYYIAKHQLNKEQAIEYITNEYNAMKPQSRINYFYYVGDPERIYLKSIMPILDDYEKIVCAN